MDFPTHDYLRERETLKRHRDILSNGRSSFHVSKIMVSINDQIKDIDFQIETAILNNKARLSDVFSFYDYVYPAEFVTKNGGK